MIGYARARGLVWSVPFGLCTVLAGAYFAHWLAARPNFDHLDRIPAVVLGGLGAAILVAPGWHRIEDEIEGSTPRPASWMELTLTAVLIAGTAGTAMAALPQIALERGGMELARDILGLSGLALLGGSIGGSRLAWVLPFLWSAASYFGVTRLYSENPHQAALGWLMFPATYPATWLIACGLLILGFAAYQWGGFMPLPRRHPRR